MIIEFVWMEAQEGEPTHVWQMAEPPRVGETVHLGMFGADPEPEEGKVVGVNYYLIAGTLNPPTCLARVVLERFTLNRSYAEPPKKTQAPLF